MGKKKKPVTRPPRKPPDRAPNPAAAPAEPSPLSAQVVDITPENEKLEGYRVVQVIAQRVGHYGLKQRITNEVFMMGLIGDGALPDWVKAVPDDGSY